MKLIIVGILAVLVTGCATPPQWLANYFDSQDPCQNVRSMPRWCGAASGRTVIYSTPHQGPLGAQVGYTQNR